MRRSALAVPLLLLPALAAAQAPVPLPVGRPAPARTVSAGERHAYTATLEAGQFARFVVDQRGVDVIVDLIGPAGDLLREVDSPNGDRGPEPVELVAPASGVYSLVVRAFDERAGDGVYEARLDEVLAPAAYAARLAAVEARRDSVVTWLAGRAIPVASVTAGSGFDDLQPLRDVLRDARIVGLGEATHGTREFFQFKHRMVEFLVRELGFRVFAIEASLSALENVIEPWVQGGPGEVEEVLDSQGFWTWSTEEVRDLLVWARAYNLSAPPAGRVHFVGIDIQVNDEGRRTVLDVLRRARSARLAEAEALFAVNADSLGEVAYVSRDSAATASVLAQLDALNRRYAAFATAVAADEAALAGATSPADAARVVRYARTLAQYVHAYSRDPGTRETRLLRDRYMAENTRRMLDARPPGTRVALWAHNDHVASDSTGARGATLGTYLRRYYGDAYYALGFSFDRGAFQAVDPGSEAPWPENIVEFQVGPAPAETADALFDRAAAQAGAGVMVVDLRGDAPSPTVRRWLAEPHGMATVGSTFRRGSTSMYAPTVLRDSFDGVVFIRETTRARLTPGFMRGR